MTRPPRPKLTPERRAQIRSAIASGKKPLDVCVEMGAAYATVVRVQREVREGTLRRKIMKTTLQLTTSADACLEQADKHCKSIMGDLAMLKYGAALGKIMPKLRIKVDLLAKNIHEFNAYKNALDT